MSAEVAISRAFDRDVVIVSGPHGNVEVTRFALAAEAASILEALNAVRGRSAWRLRA